MNSRLPGRGVSEEENSKRHDREFIRIGEHRKSGGGDILGDVDTCVRIVQRILGRREAHWPY